MKSLKELYDYREMIASLVRKDLRGRYKGSVLGFFWTFLNPLLQLMVYNIVFATILKNGIDKYYLFLFVALIPWFFFNSSLTTGSSCIIGQKNLVSKIYFPREVIPISYVTSGFVNMLLCFIVIFIIIGISGIGVNVKALLYLPLVWITEYILCLGIALIASSVTVFFRDMEHILGIVSMAWMYMTPVVYNVDVIPENYLKFYQINPMTPIISAYRDILYYKRCPELETLVHALILGSAVLVIGCIVFSKLKRHFAEEL